MTNFRITASRRMELVVEGKVEVDFVPSFTEELPDADGEEAELQAKTLFDALSRESIVKVYLFEVCKDDCRIADLLYSYSNADPFQESEVQRRPCYRERIEEAIQQLQDKRYRHAVESSLLEDLSLEYDVRAEDLKRALQSTVS